MKKNKILINSSLITLTSFALINTTLSCSKNGESNPQPEPEHPTTSNIDEELKRVNELKLSLKKEEYTTDEAFEINQDNILSNIDGFKKNDNFTYQIIDFEKPPLIEANNQVYSIKFKIQITSKVDSNSKKSNEFVLNFKIWKLEVEAERISNLNNDPGLKLTKENLTREELKLIDEKNLLTKISNLNLNTKLFEYQVTRFYINYANSFIDFDIKIFDKSNILATIDVFNLSTPFIIQSSNNNEQILNECLKNLDIQCNLTMEQRKNIRPSEATSFENAKKYFSINESKIKELGGQVNGFTPRYNEKDPTAVYIIVPIWVGTEGDSNYVSETIIKRFDGFKSEIKTGLLDELPSPNLNTPTGAKNWKGQIGLIDTKPITEGSYNDYVKKLTFNDITKEFIYQARFILYQSFRENFSEINYYSFENNNEIKVIAEGIIKNSDTRTFRVQTTGSTETGDGNVKTDDKIKVEFTINKNQQHIFNSLILNWSFDIDFKNSLPQYGVVLPGYKLKITNNDRQIYNFGNPTHLRTYCFVIGRTKTKLS